MDLAGQVITTNAQASDYIKTSGTVTANYEIKYNAGDNVHMYPGFEVNLGGIYEAFIEDCQ